jgi:hypothetical protein
MNPVAELRAAIEDLERVCTAMEVADARDGLTLLERIRESYNGWPGGSGFDRSGRQSTDREGEPLPGYSDPTGNAGTREDRAKQHHDILLKALSAVRRQATVAVDVATLYTLRAPNVIERAAVTEEPGCVSCARVTSPGTVGLPKGQQTPWWNPVARQVTLSDGSKVGLCEWCRKSPVGASSTGAMPPVAAVEAHRDGRRWGRTA